jgi:hypothetical protein
MPKIVKVRGFHVLSYPVQCIKGGGFRGVE